MQTLTGGKWKEEGLNSEFFGARDLDEYLQTQPESVVSEFLEAKVERNSALFVINSGHLGIGSRLVQEGDIVSVLFGVSMPVILRPMGEH